MPKRKTGLAIKFDDAAIDVNTLISLIHTTGVDPVAREIFLYESSDKDRSSGIDHRMANRFTKNLRILTDINPSEPILVHCSTRGGYVAEALAMYDTITLCSCPVVFLAYANVESAGSFLFQAADYRFVMPNCHFFIHRMWTWWEGSVDRIQSQLDFDK